MCVKVTGHFLLGYDSFIKISTMQWLALQFRQFDTEWIKKKNMMPIAIALDMVLSFTL